MNEYKLLDIKEADYGCEERPEGAPLMCLLVLVPTQSVSQNNKSASDYKNTDLPQTNSDSADAKDSTANKIYVEIPDALATDLGLVSGVIITEDELTTMKAGKKPSNWDSLSNRHYYETSIGTVCMSNREFVEYCEKAAEIISEKIASKRTFN